MQRQDLFQFTPEEIEYLRNGIYALSGKIFKTEQYAQYFDAQSWYAGINASDVQISKKFNEFQKRNLEILVAYEKELKSALANQ